MPFLICQVLLERCQMSEAETRIWSTWCHFQSQTRWENRKALILVPVENEDVWRYVWVRRRIFKRPKRSNYIMNESNLGDNVVFEFETTTETLHQCLKLQILRLSSWKQYTGGFILGSVACLLTCGPEFHSLQKNLRKSVSKIDGSDYKTDGFTKWLLVTTWLLRPCSGTQRSW